MPVSVRVRFEVLKRDNFTCRYCGRTSPDVILEVDHIVPECEGGSSEPMNLAASCWECNRGKSGKPLSETLTGEDPHDRAVVILERERQLREYHVVANLQRERIEADAWDLLKYWTNDQELDSYPRGEFTWLCGALETIPMETIRGFMSAAFRAGVTRDLRYVKGCVRTERGLVNG